MIGLSTVSWRFANGLETTVDLDARHRPESIDVPGVWNWQATAYDANDNILDLSTSADTYLFGYDTQNRLIDADTASIDIDYQYDKVGNRLSTGTYEPESNRIDAYGDRDYTLDANGNDDRHLPVRRDGPAGHQDHRNRDQEVHLRAER